MSFQDENDEAGAATFSDAGGDAGKTFSAGDMQALVDRIEQLKAESTAFQGTPKRPIDVEAICARGGCGEPCRGFSRFCSSEHEDGGRRETRPRTATSAGGEHKLPSINMDGGYYEALNSPRLSDAGSHAMAKPLRGAAQADFGLASVGGAYPGMSKDFKRYLSDAASDVRARFKEHELRALGQLMALGRLLLEQLNQAELAREIVSVGSALDDILYELQTGLDKSLHIVKVQVDQFTLRFNYTPERYERFMAMSRFYDDSVSDDRPRCMLEDNLNLVHQVALADLQHTRKELKNSASTSARSNNRQGNTTRHADTRRVQPRAAAPAAAGATTRSAAAATTTKAPAAAAAAPAKP
jgi:hypothetical protein